MNKIIIAILLLTSICGYSQDLLFCGTQTNNSFFSYDQSSGTSNTIQSGQTLIRRIRVDQNIRQVFWSAGGLNKIQKVRFTITYRVVQLFFLAIPMV